MSLKRRIQIGSAQSKHRNEAYSKNEGQGRTSPVFGHKAIFNFWKFADFDSDAWGFGVRIGDLDWELGFRIWD